jgi:MFS family permease
LIADLMRGTGRYNLAQGAIATLQGVGASSSGLLAGEIVDHLGYSPAFLASAVIALAAFLVLAMLLPESAEAVTAKLPRISEAWFRRRALVPSVQATPDAVRARSGTGSERREE